MSDEADKTVTKPQPERTAVDEENFRLVRSFNDVFVALASLLVFGAVQALIPTAPFLGADAFAVAAVAWGLAEYFTRVRKMALPSILYALIFCFSVMFAIVATSLPHYQTIVSEAENLGVVPALLRSEVTLAAFLFAGLAAVGFWFRFSVAIAVAISVFCVMGVLCVLLELVFEGLVVEWWQGMSFVLGAATLVFAIYWDKQDLQRMTHKSDVAFWLHLLAAPLLVQPFFWAFLNNPDPGVFDVILVFAIFVLLGTLALITNRRAVLVASVIYVITVTATFLESFHANVGYAALGVGALLLFVAAGWAPARRLLMALIPEPIARYFPLAQ